MGETLLERINNRQTTKECSKDTSVLIPDRADGKKKVGDLVSDRKSSVVYVERVTKLLKCDDRP